MFGLIGKEGVIEKEFFFKEIEKCDNDMEREVNIYNIYNKRERERREWKEGEVEKIYNVYNKERGRGRKRG